jgi:predicted phage tail protein
VTKKSNTRNKKLASSKDGANILSSGLKNAGMALVSTLIGEIVAIAVQRLLEKNSHKDIIDNESELVRESVDSQQKELHDEPNPIQANTSKLQDTVAAVKSTASEPKHAVTDIIDALKEATQQVLANSVHGIKNESEITANSLINTAKNAIDIINPSNEDRSQKKGKKKSKKKKKLALK